MKKVKILSCGSMLALGMGCVGTVKDAPDTQDVSQQSHEIIGGVPANSSRLNAVGATMWHYAVVDEQTGESRVDYDFDCTASLISSQTLLTAKHCIEDFVLLTDPRFAVFGQGARLFFHMGPDAMNPVRMVEIVGAEKAPVDTGGFEDLGRDVATFHLAEKVAEVAPLTLGTLNDRQIGQDFGTIGYGRQGNLGPSGERLAGTETLRATSGRVYELMFGSFEAFRSNELALAARNGSEEEDEGEASDAGIDEEELDPAELEASIRAKYDTTYLLDGYQAYTGNREGNTQNCYGDSGSPLVRSVGGQLRAYGVVSGGEESLQSICAFGTVYATFGKETMDFLSKSKKWVDPCKGLSTLGVCERATATRCTKPAEGPRRITKTNCSLLGQTCGRDEAGAAACIDP